MVIPSIACAIVSNVAGAEYEGVVFDRFIAVELTDGGQVELFDPGPPIGESLAPGMHARLLLVASIPTGLQLDAETGLAWQGRIELMNWQPVDQNFESARSALFDHVWVVVSTSIGHILFSPSDLPDLVSEGTTVSWENCRLDLFGIVRSDT